MKFYNEYLRESMEFAQKQIDKILLIIGDDEMSEDEKTEYHRLKLTKDSIERRLKPRPVITIDTFIQLDQELMGSLQNLYLTFNESKIYTLLVQAGKPLTATEVSEFTKIQRTETYNYLSDLMEKGLIDSDAFSLEALEEARKSYKYGPIGRVYFAPNPPQIMELYMQEKIKCIEAHKNEAIKLLSKYTKIELPNKPKEK